MFVVAVTRWGAPLERELPALAALLSSNPYDARLRLGGPLPVIFSYSHDLGVARALRQSLRERGHGAVACDMERRPTAATLVTPHGFSLTESGLLFTGPGELVTPVATADVMAMVQALQVVAESGVTETSKKKFSLGRAVISGGLSTKKKTSAISREVSEETEQVLYVFMRDRRPPILLRQNHLRYAGLGDLMSATRFKSFGILLDLLSERCPTAHFDTRLLLSRRKASTLAVSKSREKDRGAQTSKSAVIQSNADATDLAAHLIVVALAQGQLLP